MLDGPWRAIDYERGRPFPWFVKQVTVARRTGDIDLSKALSKAFIPDINKALENISYSKLIEDKQRQTNIIYMKDEKVVDQALRSAFV